MHIANGKQNLGDVKHGDIVAKTTIFAKSVEELPTRTELEQHINESLILERGLQGIDERMVQLVQDFLLQFNMLHLFQIHDVRLRNLFQC